MLGQTGRQGNLVPEIAGQRDHPHAQIGTLERPQDIQRAVVAAVVHIDDFEIQAGDAREHTDQAAVGLANDRHLVEAGDDDGEESWHVPGSVADHSSLNTVDDATNQWSKAKSMFRNLFSLSSIILEYVALLNPHSTESTSSLCPTRKGTVTTILRSL